MALQVLLEEYKLASYVPLEGFKISFSCSFREDEKTLCKYFQNGSKVAFHVILEGVAK